MKLAACALALVGCYDPDPLYCQMHGSDTVNCPRIGSASGSGDCHDIAALGFTACLVTTPGTPVQIGMNTTFDTGTGASSPAGLSCAMLDSTSSNACVLAGTSITISAGATLFVTGTKPLALASDTTIDISGTLDVASHSATKGPAADSSACVAGTAATGGGGGAGGSFGTQGGTGGDQYQKTGSRATPGAVQTASALRGGCPGSQGSSPVGGSSTAGSGGGAVALLAQSIPISGAINASGAGGGGGHDAGGGGGGSGGMIALSAMSIMLTGRVWANGGHGGGGSNGQDGQSGTDPDGPTSGGGGGNGNNPAGDGASGYPSATTNGSPGTGNVPVVNIGAAGGGGGGGAGTIMTFGTTAISGPSVSPPSK